VTVLLACVALVHGPVVTHELLDWDDDLTIAHNQDLGSAAGLAKAWRHPHMALYIPVTYTVWGLLAVAARVGVADPQGVSLNPAVFHLASVVVHGLCVLLVWGVVRRFVGGDWPAAAGALLFALHPVQVETVAWASGLKDLLAVCLGLCAVLLYLLGGDAAGRRRFALLAVATAAFVAALLSKPSAVVVPVICWVLGGWQEGRLRPHAWPLLAGWMVLSLGCAVLTKLVQPGVDLAPVAWSHRPLVALDALAFYLWKLAWPMHLAPDYGRSPQVALGSSWIRWTWIVPLAATLSLAALPGRRRWLLAAAMFLVPLLPVLGLVPFHFQYYSTVADHYLYLALLGPALALGWAMVGRGRWAAWACAAWLAMLGAGSLLQARHWADTQSLWAHTLKVNPASFVASHKLAALAEDRGDRQTALSLYDAAIRRRPDHALSHQSKGFLLIAMGRKDEALESLQTARRIYASWTGPHRGDLGIVSYTLGLLLIEKGRMDEAIEVLEEALSCLPADRHVQQALREARDARPAATQVISP